MRRLIDKFARAGYTNYREGAQIAARASRGNRCASAPRNRAWSAADGAVFAGFRSRSGAGEALIVIGPNGAGNRACCARIAGFLPCRRAICAGGRRKEQPVGEQAHYLGHADALKGALTAGENLAFWAGVLGGEGGRSAGAPRSPRLGLAHVSDFPVRALSAGQKRRVALARLLVAAPPALAARRADRPRSTRRRRRFRRRDARASDGGGLIVAATPWLRASAAAAA